jgi:hypothetical protein
MSSVILNDPLESNANWAGTSTIVAGRTANCMRVAGSAGVVVYTIASGSRSAANKVDFWWRASQVGGGSNRTVAQLRGPTGTVYVSCGDTVGGDFRFTLGTLAGTVIGTTTTTPVANTWNHIELYCKPGVGSTGAVIGILNGVTLANSSLLNMASASPIESVALSGNGSTTATHDFDDFVLTNEIGVVTKVWNGSAFVDGPVRTFNGTAFVDAVAIKTFNGSAFV